MEKKKVGKGGPGGGKGRRPRRLQPKRSPAFQRKKQEEDAGVQQAKWVHACLKAVHKVLKKAKTFERRKVQRRVVEAKEANASKPSVPFPEPDKLAVQLEALKNVDLDALAEKVVQKYDLVPPLPPPSQQQQQQQQQQEQQHKGYVLKKQQPLMGSVEEVLGQRLMRAGCVRKQVEDLKKEFGRRFRQRGPSKGKASSAQEAAQKSTQPSANGPFNSDSGAREQRGAQQSSLGTDQSDEIISDEDRGGESESGNSELQGSSSSSGSEGDGNGGLGGSLPLRSNGEGGVVTGPGGVQIRLERGGMDSEGQGVSSSKRRRLGSGVEMKMGVRSGSEDEDGEKGAIGDEERGSDSCQGSDEFVTDLDGDGGEFRGMMMEGDNDEESGGASSFDSRDYDMPAGGGLVKDGKDTAESSGKNVPEKGSSKEDKTVSRRGERASIGSSAKATGKEVKQHAEKKPDRKEGKGGEKAKKQDMESKGKPGGAKRGRDIKALLKGTASGKRLGQRARRALAEKLYGMNARHVQEMLEGHSRPHGKAGAKDSSSNAKQPASGAAETTNPVLSAEQLHPSWAAKMQQKQKASLAAPSPAAKKIKFDEGGSIVEEAGPAPQPSTDAAAKNGGAGKWGRSGSLFAGKKPGTQDEAGKRNGKPSSGQKAVGAHTGDLKHRGGAGFMDRKSKHGGKPGVSRPGGQAVGRASKQQSRGKGDKGASRPVHPSWEAKQKARKAQQQREAGAKPQGKKTVFSDD